METESTNGAEVEESKLGLGSRVHTNRPIAITRTQKRTVLLFFLEHERICQLFDVSRFEPSVKSHASREAYLHRSMMCAASRFATPTGSLQKVMCNGSVGKKQAHKVQQRREGGKKEAFYG